jgi:tetratricopeptide (TPR) repeat protein
VLNITQLTAKEKTMQKNFSVAFIIVLLILFNSDSNASTAEQEYHQANKQFAKGNYSQAVHIYQSLLADPFCGISPSVLYTRIADSYFNLGDYRNALYAYRRALIGQRESEKPATQYWIGFSMLMLGKRVDAVNEFLKIPALYPESGMWISTAYYWAGRACEQMGQRELAAEYFGKAGGSGRSTQERFALEKAKEAKGK